MCTAVDPAPLEAEAPAPGLGMHLDLVAAVARHPEARSGPAHCIAARCTGRGLLWRRCLIHLALTPAEGLSIDGSCAHKEVPVPSAIALVNTAVRSVFDNLVFIMSPRIPVTRLNTGNGEEFRSFD